MNTTISFPVPQKDNPPPAPESAAPVAHAHRSTCLPLLVCAALFAVPAAAQTLTNGFDQAGTLVLNTTNSYTFYATNGDTVLLRVGAPTFRPLVTLHAPNGTVLAAGSGAGSSSIDATTPAVPPPPTDCSRCG